MWIGVLDKALEKLFQTGAAEITFPDGRTRRYGDPAATPHRIRITDPSLPRRLCLNADLALGEGYMDGGLTFENDDLRGFLATAFQNRVQGNEPGAILWGREIMRPIQRHMEHHLPGAARRNVAHHYDLSRELYDLFLDSDRQYSCAYFPDPDMTLDAAQEAKKHHIAKKLCIQPGDRVLDIGCGWGGMAMTLARDYGAQVVGITLSKEQVEMARARVAEAGLEDRVDIRLQDYRRVKEDFERIVSVGMFEHVGRAQYRAYFDTVARLLTSDGVALIHTIGNSTPPRATSTWIRRYIFPGGYLPSMSEVVTEIEKAGLTTLDIEVWRLHYARTLRHWYDRFMDGIDRARALYDERFCRMWRYYLTASEMAFVHERLAVFQFQIGHSKTAVPLTRDYLYTAGG